MRRGGGVCVRERDEAERRDRATSWGEVSPVSQSLRVAVSGRRESIQRGGEEEKEDIFLHSLPV